MDCTRIARISILGLLVLVEAIPAQIGAIPSMTGNAVEGVLGLPYSARRHFTSVEKSADSTTRRSESGGSEARDTQGRTYTAGERHWTYMENGKSARGTEMLFRIHDPVSHTDTTWDSTSKTAKVIHWPKEAQGATLGISALLPPLPGPVEDLGSRRIDGVMAEGKRSTYTITEGNDSKGQPLRVVHESWYCPELKIVVLETHDDPRSGTWKNELVKIIRGEPDVTEYRPPADYVVNHVRAPSQDRP